MPKISHQKYQKYVSSRKKFYGIGARIPFIKEYNLDDFEFSQGFCFFWDKVIFYPVRRMMNIECQDVSFYSAPPQWSVFSKNVQAVLKFKFC